jgi:hypothetical protein
MAFISSRTIRFGMLGLFVAAIAAVGTFAGQGAEAQQPDLVRAKLSPLLRSLLYEAETPLDPGSPDFAAREQGRRQRLEALAIAAV